MVKDNRTGRPYLSLPLLWCGCDGRPKAEKTQADCQVGSSATVRQSLPQAEVL